MSRKHRTDLERSTVRERPLPHSNDEGAEASDGPQHGSAAGEFPGTAPALSNAELVQLQVRVIALENLVIALLSQASPQQLELVREMAGYISPRAGFTPHRLTIHAAAQIVHLAERAGRFADSPPSGGPAE